MLGNPSTGKKEVPVNYRNLLHRIVVIPLVIAVSALLGCGETIEIDRASFSGQGVVDEAENPIAELALVIIPCKVDDDTLIAVYDAETNDTGHFSITGIYPGKAQFMLVPEYQEGLPLEPEYQLLSFKIGVLAYYPKDLSLCALHSGHLFYRAGRANRKRRSHSATPDANSRENRFCRWHTLSKQRG